MTTTKHISESAYAVLAQTNAAYAALRENRQAYEALLKERRAWEVTLSDGLDEYLLEDIAEWNADAADETQIPANRKRTSKGSA
ncbi:MAG: hypothetical protein HPY83_09950 [Anaerolineae bacterium]|nr:hypothetical protein [Anaerolineae bacterium]